MRRQLPTAFASAAVAFGICWFFGGLAVAIPVGFVVFAGTFVWARMKQSAISEDTLQLDELEMNTRTRIRPLTRHRDEIAKMVAQNPDNPVLSALSVDVSMQVDDIIRHAIEVVRAKTKIQKLSSQAYQTRAAIDELETKIRNADDAEVKQATQSALDARQAELKNYEELETTAQRLDANLEQAESALAELRSRVTLAAADASGARSMAEDELQQLTGRLQTLGSTMQESVDAIKTGAW